MTKKTVFACLFNFLVAALMGLLLRYHFVHPLPLDFRYFTHAHSHGAILGWVYLMLYLLLVRHFVPEKRKIFTYVFWATQIAVLGMFITFPIQGYAAASISFSTLHIVCSYLFIYLIWKHQRVASTPLRWMLKAALVFMFVSTMGIWCLGPAAALYGGNSIFFQISIQFFLHYQFNGWFMMAIMAIFLREFHVKDGSNFRRFFYSMLAGIVLTFALIVNWYLPHPVWSWLNALGVTLQMVAGYYFIKLLQPRWTAFWSSRSLSSKWMLGLALTSFTLKVVLQFLSAVPAISTMALNHREFVIGFIHMVMLGVVSGFLFSFLLESRFINNQSGIIRFATYSFIIGFICTELLLLFQGGYFYFSLGYLPQYYLLIFLCSILLPLGIFFFILNLFNYDQRTIKKT